MNRIIPAVLFVLLLYNMVGYSIVYLKEQRQEIAIAGRQFVTEAGDGTLVIKVPVQVPYQNSWDAPEAVEGEIEHEGHFYQMQSRQLINDTLYVNCRYDQGARDRFADLASKIHREVTGNAASQQKDAHSAILKHFLKEYMSQERKHTFFLLEWAPEETVVFAAPDYMQTDALGAVPSPPPDLLS